MMKAKMLIALLVPFLVASCDDSPVSPQVKEQDINHPTQVVGVVPMAGGDADIYRWHDNQVKATCWVLRRNVNGGYGGISCVADGFLVKPDVSPASTESVDGFPEDGPDRHVAGGPGA